MNVLLFFGWRSPSWCPKKWKFLDGRVLFGGGHPIFTEKEAIHALVSDLCGFHSCAERNRRLENKLLLVFKGIDIYIYVPVPGPRTPPPPPQWYGPPTPPHHPHLGDDADNAGDAVQYRALRSQTSYPKPNHPATPP